MTLAIDEVKKKQINLEIKLHINQRLYEKGHITEEMFEKAKEKILKS